MIRRGSDVENSPEIVWQELAPDLWEARLVEPTGLTVYAGYMAQSADADPWRGYIGIDFVFVARGERAEVRRTLEEAADVVFMQRISLPMAYKAQNRHYQKWRRADNELAEWSAARRQSEENDTGQLRLDHAKTWSEMAPDAPSVRYKEVLRSSG